ncbi:hypothetical protein SAMN06295912_10431 [Sphingomonas laterariae]|uniref:DUF937 domain-containing protein n=1 Tax=Edaphosphingomonas laterariae TaxID=861865 RepID=A0A239DD63_9SPHN|nr:hypothetical protein [Sphingomonas laterariae]SNS29928.1 hypothetical protein SAMN06295912_10431 [Sphingomonas laterariae]
MGLLDGLLGQAGNVDIDALAGQLGMSPDELRTGGETLLGKLAGGGQDNAQAAMSAAAETGLPLDKLQALLPALASQLGEGGIDGLLAKLGGADGLLGMLDRDGDGNPINDIAGIAKGLLGGR